MPIKRCTKDGKSGWQYGNQHCYTGPGAKRKAIRQMQAIKISESKGFLENMANAIDPELALVNAIAEVNLSDQAIDLALEGHGIFKYNCGHIKKCFCEHKNMNFNVNCLCPDCLKEE
jgi:hypothetical protein